MRVLSILSLHLQRAAIFHLSRRRHDIQPPKNICDFIWWPTIAMDGGFWMHRKLMWGNEGDMFAGYSFRAK